MIKVNTKKWSVFEIKFKVSNSIESFNLLYVKISFDVFVFKHG